MFCHHHSHWSQQELSEKSITGHYPVIKFLGDDVYIEKTPFRISIRTIIFLLQKYLHNHRTVEAGRDSWDHPSATEKVDRRCHHFVMRPKGQLLHEHKAYALLLSIKTRWSKLQMTGQSRKWQQVTKGSLFWLKTKIIHIKSSNEWMKEKATALLSRKSISLVKGGGSQFSGPFTQAFLFLFLHEILMEFRWKIFLNLDSCSPIVKKNWPTREPNKN